MLERMRATFDVRHTDTLSTRIALLRSRDSGSVGLVCAHLEDLPNNLQVMPIGRSQAYTIEAMPRLNRKRWATIETAVRNAAPDLAALYRRSEDTGTVKTAEWRDECARILTAFGA